MNTDCDLTGEQAQNFGGFGIMDLIDQIDLQKMITRTKSSELVTAPLQGPDLNNPCIRTVDLPQIHDMI